MTRIVFALVAASGIAATASAATITHTGSIGTTTTNWNTPVFLPLFDPALGTLTNVAWTLNGNVAGTARFESLDAGATTVSLDLAATLTLFAPDSSVLEVTIPTVNTSVSASAFDGLVDFGGTSGGTFTNLSGTATSSNNSSVPSFLALFTGVGLTSISVTGSGSSSGTGGGNLITQFATSAGSSFEIIYTYDPIPTPSALALLGLGGLAAARRRR
jgi:hypothetical protein